MKATIYVMSNVNEQKFLMAFAKETKALESAYLKRLWSYNCTAHYKYYYCFEKQALLKSVKPLPRNLYFTMTWNQHIYVICGGPQVAGDIRISILALDNCLKF